MRVSSPVSCPCNLLPRPSPSPLTLTLAHTLTLTLAGFVVINERWRRTDDAEDDEPSFRSYP